MKEKILKILHEKRDEYVSGEELARLLSVSRTSIWKHIRQLKKEGYEISAGYRNGYALGSNSKRVLPLEIVNCLRTEKIGQKVHYRDEVNSTNNIAKELANQGEPTGSIVVADNQSAGRGRLARSWVSVPRKSILVSIILRPSFLPHHAPKCTLMAAVAVVKAVQRATGLQCGIKWPNDILLGGKKIAGILTEMNAEIDKINHIVIGVGINVNTTQAEMEDDIKDIATSLRIESNTTVNRAGLLCDMLLELEGLYMLAEREGFDAILDEWRRMSVTLGEAVEVISVDEKYDGIAIDIDNDGALLVKTKDGINKVIAGDVSIRKKRYV